MMIYTLKLWKKTQYVHFTLKSTVLYEVPIGYNNSFISNSTGTKFLGEFIENTLSWKSYIDHLLPKLCMACYSVTTIKPFMCQENLKSSFHSLMTYGMIFWGNCTHNIHVFQLQNRVIGISTESRPSDSYRHLRKWGFCHSCRNTFVPFYYTLNNKALFQMNFEIHSINFSSTTRQFDNIQNGTYCTGIKVLNYLPTYIKNFSHNVDQFRLALRDFLHFHSSYTLEEFFNSSSN